MCRANGDTYAYVHRCKYKHRSSFNSVMKLCSFEHVEYPFGIGEAIGLIMGWHSTNEGEVVEEGIVV